MSKVFGVHQFELKPGVKPEDFEQALQREFAKAPDLPGFTAHLGKGDRGDQAGNYLFMWEIESVERRDQVMPAPARPSEEAQQYMQATSTLWQVFNEMATPAWKTFTDYVVIANT